jgi:AAA+ superfamily predicted ATPase
MSRDPFTGRRGTGTLTSSTTARTASLYTGYAAVVAALTIGLTLTAGVTIHRVLATTQVTTPAGALTASGLLGTVLVLIAVSAEVVSYSTDALFAGALTAPDGRYLVGVSGLVGTVGLAGMWTRPAWDQLAPSLVISLARQLPVSPASPLDSLVPLALVIPVLAGVYGYLTVTGGTYSSPTPTQRVSRTDPESPSVRVSPPTPTGARTTHVADTVAQRSHDGWPHGSLSPQTDDEHDELESPAKSERDDAGGSISDADWEQDASPERGDATGADEWTDAEHADAPVDGVDLSEYEFNWVTETNVRMADVGGMDNVKEELHRDIMTPMIDDPKKAKRYDIPLPNLLLHGPPGTGKTYLAKALATELGLPFVELSGSDVTSKWINASSEMVGTLFEEAEALAGEAGGAVIFLDELDAILPERSGESHEENRKVVNEFLSHLQESSRNRVLFVGATNKREALDSAATRNGRIDKEIFVGEPDEEARVKIFEAQLAGRPHDLSEDDVEELAAVTDGVVAADIEGIVNQAARNAAYGRDAPIEMEDIVRQLDQ